VIRTPSIRLNRSTHEPLDQVLRRELLELLLRSDIAAVPDITIRSGGAGLLGDGTQVRWISFKDQRSDAWLLPDIRAARSIVSGDSLALDHSLYGTERFSSAELGLLILDNKNSREVNFFVPAACRSEALEHFFGAVAGRDEPSFLFSALQEQITYVLGDAMGLEPHDQGDYLAWIRSLLSFSVVSFEGLVSSGTSADKVVLEINHSLPSSRLFSEMFGSETLRCEVSFGDPKAPLVPIPSFRWFHRG
jgi:hypothetical protein